MELRLVLSVLLGFFLPGYFLSLYLRSPVPFVSAYILSEILLFSAVFLLETIHIPLTYWTITVLLSIITLAAFLLWRYRTGKDSVPVLTIKHSSKTRRMQYLMLWAFSIVSIIFILRAVMQPLSGFDTDFRWDFLAQLILSHGHFRFYPPVSGEDFYIYFYPDGIPPMVSFSYFYLYSAKGKAVSTLTAIPVLIQAYCIVVLVKRMTRFVFGAEAGSYALGILASSPLLLWAVLMGQETGLTVISLLGTLFFLMAADEGYKTQGIMLAGFSTALGVLSREYGWAFVVCGAIACIWRKRGFKPLVLYTGTVILIGVPWYLRNWVLTGNPVYSHEVDSLFRINPVYAQIMKYYIDILSFRNNAGPMLTALVYFLSTTALIPFLLGTAGIISFFKRHFDLAISCFIVVILWCYSVGRTTGGLFYSMRVLSPCLAILSVLGGGIVHYLSEGYVLRKRLILVGLTSFILYAAICDLVIPRMRYVFKPGDWIQVGFTPRKHLGAAIGEIIKENEGTVLTDNFYVHAFLSPRGISVVPIWSPEMNFLVSANLGLKEASEMLHEKGIHYVVCSANSLNNRFLIKLRFYKELWEQVPPFAVHYGHIIYKLTMNK